MCVIGLVIGIITAAMQYRLMGRVVAGLTENRYTGHRVAALLLLHLLLWAAALAGSALISLPVLFWAAGAMVTTTFCLALKGFYMSKRAGG